MNRQSVLTGFHHPHAHQHPHAHVHQGHYRVPAQSHYQNGLAFAIRAPVLPPASYNHHHTGHHHRNPHLNMAAYPSDEDYAHLQKLSSEYEPEATVSLPFCARDFCTPADRPPRAHLWANARAAPPSRRNMPRQTPSSRSRRRRCLQSMPTSAPVVAMATADGGVSCQLHLCGAAAAVAASANANSNRLHLL